MVVLPLTHVAAGSIVLIHANGNEPLGVSRFIDLLRRERAAVRERRRLLLELRESLVEAERGPRRQWPDALGA